MPTSPVANRRNLDKLPQRTLGISDEARAILRRRAKDLHVSQASLLSAFVMELGRMPDQVLLDLMIAHDMMSEDEYGIVLDLVAKNKQKNDQQDPGAPSE